MAGVNAGVTMIACCRGWPALQHNTRRRILMEAAVTRADPEMFDPYGFVNLAQYFEGPFTAYADTENDLKPLSSFELVLMLGSIDAALKAAEAAGNPVEITRDGINHLLVIAASVTPLLE